MKYSTNIQSELYQLSNPLREAMLKADAAKSLVVLEGLYMLRFAADTWLTFDQIYRLCGDNFGMSYQLVYQGLRHTQIFQRRKAERLPHQRGARPYLYRLPHPDELQAEFTVKSGYTPHDELSKDDLKSVSHYRRALHRELFIRKWINNQNQGFIMSRQLMADRLAVPVRTVRTYDKQLGHSHEPNYKEVPITSENWFKLPRYKDKYDANGKRLPSKIWLRILNYDVGEYQNLPCVRYLAYKALNAGHRVWAVERLPNTYYPYQRPDLSQFDSWDALSHWYAENDARQAAGFYENRDGGWSYQRDKFLSNPPATAHNNTFF